MALQGCLEATHLQMLRHGQGKAADMTEFGGKMPESKLKIKIDEFFAINPHRAYCVLVDADPDPGMNTFIVVTQALEVAAFDRPIDDGSFSAELLADWMNGTDEGQDTVARMMAGADEESRRSDEIQATTAH
jgi:hypothetical protein